jgi:phosphate transport system substrate-binding protein
MKRIRFYITGSFLAAGLLLNWGCGGDEKKSAVTDTPSSGTIHISVDESFRPVIEEEISVYEASFPGTKIIAEYKPEAECLRDLYSDSANRMVIVTRGLTSKESRFYADSLSYAPVSDRIATDAITIVVNASSNDTLFTKERLRQQLSGGLGNKQVVVFDGLRATSIVRYAMDSLLGGKSFDTSVVKAAKNSREVLETVASTPNAIGLVGFSWIGNPEDTAQVNMLKKVKIAYVKCEVCVDTPYVKPSQSGILSKRYPLVRGLYYILKENYSGLGSGFAQFMKYERGQLIFRRAYLGPVMGFEVRSVKINEKL